MIPAGGASQTLPRIVGASAALHAILTAERVPAGRALAQGFVDHVVPRDQLRAFTDALADRVAARPTAAVRAAKAAVWWALDLSLAVGLQREQDVARTLTA
jgi:enoyl-CoA hydratase